MKTLLVLDDSANDRELVRCAVGESYTIDDASVPDEAIQKLIAGKHAAVLVDLIFQPPIFPAELVKAMRQASPKTAIVLFSGSTDPRLIGEGMQAGADAYIDKGPALAAGEMLRQTLDSAIIRRMIMGD